MFGKRFKSRGNRKSAFPIQQPDQNTSLNETAEESVREVGVSKNDNQHSAGSATNGQKWRDSNSVRAAGGGQAVPTDDIEHRSSLRNDQTNRRARCGKDRASSGSLLSYSSHQRASYRVGSGAVGLTMGRTNGVVESGGEGNAERGVHQATVEPIFFLPGGGGMDEWSDQQAAQVWRDLQRRDQLNSINTEDGDSVLGVGPSGRFGRRSNSYGRHRNSARRYQDGVMNAGNDGDHPLYRYYRYRHRNYEFNSAFDQSLQRARALSALDSFAGSSFLSGDAIGGTSWPGGNFGPELSPILSQSPSLPSLSSIGSRTPDETEVTSRRNSTRLYLAAGASDSGKRLHVEQLRTRCGCGRSRSNHEGMGGHGGSSGDADRDDQSPNQPQSLNRWTIQRNTLVMDTNAFGTIEFQGGPHPHKAQYVRLGFDSDPEDILELFRRVWGIKPPKLVITVHGGIANFDLQPKLARVFRKGLLKAAKTTGAWIITSGINVGVVRQVAAALSDNLSNRSSSKNKIVTIGIAPWGLLKKREDFLGKDTVVSYHPRAFSPRGKLAILNDKHNYFLLVDNGTVGRYGADIILRKRLEEYISNQTIGSSPNKKSTFSGGKRIPVVCVVLEGGQCTVRSVLDYVTNNPPVPVVVCDGSGRAADLIAFTYHHITPSGLRDSVKKQLMSLVEDVFKCDSSVAKNSIQELQLCVRKRNLITVFRLGEDSQQDVDHAILTALLKGQGDLPPTAQLSLALAWNRFIQRGFRHYRSLSVLSLVDIARSEIFVLGTDWPVGSLDAAMMEALAEDRVEFVKLLLENGVSMERFLTIQRLEDLYNSERGPQNTLRHIVRSVVGNRPRMLLKDIGLTMEKLMGSAYQSMYCSHEFQAKYNQKKSLKRNLIAGDLRQPSRIVRSSHEEVDQAHGSGGLWTGDPDFAYPFNELLIWAVLTKRSEMARCMWQHGEEALAKSLVACKLYKSMSYEAAEDQTEIELFTEFSRSSEEFKKMGMELLEHCYQTDKNRTLRLLTYELKNWGKHTCLSLAVIANHKAFIAHTCCQGLLADLWHGGLSIRKSSNLKVIAGLLFPPLIFKMEFKTKDELMLQPQTAEEHADEMRESESDDSDSSMSNDSSSLSNSLGGGGGRGGVEGVVVGDLEGGHSRDFRVSNQLRRSSSKISVSSTLFNKMAANIGGGGGKKSRGSHAGGGGGGDGGGRSPVILGRNNSRKQKHHSDPAETSMSKSEPGGTRNSGRVNPCFKDGGMNGGVESSQSRGKASKALSRLSFRSVNPYRNDKSPKQAIFNSNSLPLQKGYNGNNTKSISHESSGSRNHGRTLPLSKKIYEFYVAPITTFWFFTLSYLCFLVTFTYNLLIRTPRDVTWPEYYCAAFVFTMGIDLFFKISTMEPRIFKSKVKVFFARGWNILRVLSIVTYLMGFSLRTQRESLETGRVMLCMNIILWYVQLLELMSVNAELGLYVTMVMKMVTKMMGILMILLVVLTAFGISWQTIRFQDEEWSWILVRNIFYKPYFMLYGEVYANEIDPCNDDYDKKLLQPTEDNEICVPGVWLAPICMFVFLLISNILLINLLIAVFNNVYQQMNAQSQELWRFGRYWQVMEFEASPPFPPPLIIICDVYRTWKYIRRCRKHSNSEHHRMDFSLKLFLASEDIERLHDFEEECMDDLYQEKLNRKNQMTDEKITKTHDRVEYMTMKMADLVSKETATKNGVVEVEKKLDIMENKIQRLHEEMISKTDMAERVEQLQIQLRRIASRLNPPQQRPYAPRSTSMETVMTTEGLSQSRHQQQYPNSQCVSRRGSGAGMSPLPDPLSLSLIRSSQFLYAKQPPPASFHDISSAPILQTNRPLRGEDRTASISMTVNDSEDDRLLLDDEDKQRRHMTNSASELIHLAPSGSGVTSSGTGQRIGRTASSSTPLDTFPCQTRDKSPIIELVPHQSSHPSLLFTAGSGSLRQTRRQRLHQKLMHESAAARSHIMLSDPESYDDSTASSPVTKRKLHRTSSSINKNHQTLPQKHHIASKDLGSSSQHPSLGIVSLTSPTFTLHSHSVEPEHLISGFSSDSSATPSPQLSRRYIPRSASGLPGTSSGVIERRPFMRSAGSSLTSSPVRKLSRKRAADLNSASVVVSLTLTESKDSTPAAAAPALPEASNVLRQNHEPGPSTSKLDEYKPLQGAEVSRGVRRKHHHRSRRDRMDRAKSAPVDLAAGEGERRKGSEGKNPSNIGRTETDPSSYHRIPPRILRKSNKNSASPGTPRQTVDRLEKPGGEQQQKSPKPSLQTLRSCPASVSPPKTSTASLTPSTTHISRRKNDEYTSITDYIQVHHDSDESDLEALEAMSANAHVLSRITEEPSSSSVGAGLEGGSLQKMAGRSGESSAADLDTDNPESLSGSLLSVVGEANLHRAQKSFVRNQNEVFREFEEMGSRITGGLIGGRIRKESERVGQVDNEDLKEMGLHDKDVEDYLACLEPSGSHLSTSSSQETLSSDKIEDGDGFQQINEILQSASHSRQGSGLSSSGVVAGPYTASADQNANGSHHSPTPRASLLNTPLTSPGTGSKAGQMFTFDSNELENFVNHMDEEEKKHQKTTNVDDDED